MFRLLAVLLLCSPFPFASLLVSVAFCDLVCEPGKTYVQWRKKTANYADEESFEILSGSTVLFTSPTFANNEQRDGEFCLPSSTNDQYTLKLKDAGEDSWSNNSWLSVSGLYGNIVFKNYMTANVEESFNLSLYYAVSKNQEWKMTSSMSSIPSGWNTASFADADWTAVTLGSVSSTPTGTQYFRKQFTGLTNMAAYELQFNFQHGIIAYLNGAEVFREHMEDGDPSPSSISEGAYISYGFHGVIRSANDVVTSSNILAVELHFPSLLQYPVLFDTYVAALASTTPIDEETKCFIYPYTATVSNEDVSNPSRAFDFQKTGASTIYKSQLPADLGYALNGAVAYVNGLRVWPYSRVNNAPKVFKWMGSMDSTTWSTILDVTDGSYTSLEHKVYTTIFNARNYKAYRLTVTAGVSDNSVSAYEIQPVTCFVDLPSGIEFAAPSYSFYAIYQDVLIQPTSSEFFGCSVTPALPNGLTMNSQTCTISGKATATIAPTTFTVSTTINGYSFQGTFSLELTTCAGTLTRVTRVYRNGASYEAYTITDMTTQQVVLSVAPSSGQNSGSTVVSILCLENAKYMIDVGGNRVYWDDESFLYLHAMINSDEYDTIARIRYDNFQGLPEDRVVNVKWSVAPQSQWFYKKGEVPANWFNGETTGWETGSIGSFAASTNQIQLYKKTFTVDSLTDVGAFVISLRYLYGCLIYMNGVEVFRNGVNGDLTASSVGLNVFNDLLYRQVSLPVKTMASGDTPAVNYLQEGSNTIAISIVSQLATQTASHFDCVVRLIGASGVSRLFDVTVSYNNIEGNPVGIPSQYYGYSMKATTCNDNYWTVSFNNYRREWISSIGIYLSYSQTSMFPRQFVLKARNSNTEEWTTLKTVTGMQWSLQGEYKKMWVDNSKPYNQYRFENFATGDATSCAWLLSALDLYVDSTLVTIPDLAFQTPILINKDIEMGEVYPNSDYYYDFTITPALPVGISIDSNTGKLSGTATELSPATQYTIHAKRFCGGESTTVVSIAVEYCTGVRSLITLVAMTDPWPEESSYKLYAGKGKNGQVVSSIPAFRAKSALNYGDFCVEHGIYTLELLDSGNDGWKNPAGWYLTIDVGAMVFEMGQLGNLVSSVTTLFSSLLPFQINYDDWKLYNSGNEVASNWKDIDFDDSAWATKKAADLGNHVAITAYLRREVNIPAIDDYHVLNVRVKYVGGIVAYFNGRLVARFNLNENFNEMTTAVAAHDASVFSKFHVILSTVGAVTGKNVIAFEIHQAPSLVPIVFDATGVFGVNDCSPVVDSFASIEAPAGTTCSKEDLLDLNPTTFGNIPNEADSYLSWMVENLEGSKFNSFALHTNNAVARYAFSVYGRYETVDEYTSALFVTDQTTLERGRKAWAIPVCIAGFRQFKFEVNSPASFEPSTNAYITQFCKASGSGSCPAIGDYPSVGEGEISPASCAEGFRGYAYRECANGVLGEVKTDKCEYKLPADLNYQGNNLVFILDTEVSSGAPSFVNLITEFYMQEDTPLPDGLTIDEKTGVISGKPSKLQDAVLYTVRGKNPKGETFISLAITVRKGSCPPEGVFDTTPVGETAVYQCSKQGSYVGSQKRACVLGKKDGEWQQASGFCVPVYGIVILILVIILIIVVVVFLVMRTTRKAKATGGVKGKTMKAAKATKTAKKDGVEKKKTVKV